MTPGVAANVREVISSSLRSWIIESLERFGVDSRVFLHVIQSILEEDGRSLRGEEDALDDLWRGRLASIGPRRGGRDPKRQMNEDDLRRCVLLENIRACFKEDEFDVAEEFVDELLNRWTEEAQLNDEANGGMKKSGQDLRDEMEDEDNKEMKDPVREYNEAFPALGSSTRGSPADQTEPTSDGARRQNRNCAELLKELIFLNASSESDCRKDTMRGPVDRAKCCREMAKSLARDFVNSSVVAAANTQQNYSASLRSNELLFGRSDAVPDLSRRFLADDLRRPDNCADVGSGLTSEGSGGSLPVPPLQGQSMQEGNGHFVELANDACPTWVEGGKVFAPLFPKVLSQTVEMILSQGLTGVACGHVPRGCPNVGACLRCIQCSRGLDFPIYTENEFGMLIRLGEDCSRVSDGKGCGKRVFDASHLVVGVGKDALPVSSDSLSMGAMEKIVEEAGRPLSGIQLGPVLPDEGSAGKPGQGRSDWLRHQLTATGLTGGHRVFDDAHQAEQRRDGEGCDDSAVREPDLFTSRLNSDPETRKGLLDSDGGRCLTGKMLEPIRTPGYPVCSGIVGTDGPLRKQSSEPIVSQSFGGFTELAGATSDRTDTSSGNVDSTSSPGVSSRLVSSDCALMSHAVIPRQGDSTSATSCELVLRLLADVIERDLMNHIAASLIPLFPDLSTPRTLFMPDTEILAHIAVRHCVPRRPHCPTTVEGGSASRAGTCEGDYMLYLHLAVRQEGLDVDHVLNFEEFCRWRRCLLEQATGSGRNESRCTCRLCDKALRRPADSRYAFVDVKTAVVPEAGCRPLPNSERASSERESLLIAKCKPEELQSEKRPLGSCVSPQPAAVLDACLQNSCAGTGDFTGRFDGIKTSRVPSGKDGIYSCSSVGEGDVLQRKYCPTGVFGRNSLREIWPDGDMDRKGRSGLKEHLEEENNNVLESFGFLPECGSSWPASHGVAVGNSVNIWLNSGSSLAGASACRRTALASKSCDKTVLPAYPGDENISVAGEYNSAGYAYDFSTSAADICDKVASADAVCNKSATLCNRPSLPDASFSEQSALIANSCDESFSTDSSYHNWFFADGTNTATGAVSSVAPPESKVECLSPSIRTLEGLLSSDEKSSSAESFRSALHEDFYSLWLNTSPSSIHGHESGPLYAEETSSDCGSQSLGSDEDALLSSEAHYEADISSSDSSPDEGSCSGDGVSDLRRSVESRKTSTAKKDHQVKGGTLFGLSFSLPSESFSPVGVDDVVRTRHSRFQSSSQSSLDSSEATEETSESDVSKPYSAAFNSGGEHQAIAEECKGLLSDWDLRRQQVESYEGPAADRFQTDSEDLEEPILYRNWEERSSENVGGVMPAWNVNPPDPENLAGLTFGCGQQEVVDLEKFEKLKFIWDELQVDDCKDLTADCEPQVLECVRFEEASFSEAFSQLDVGDIQGQSQSCDLEGPNYRNLAVLWNTDRAEAPSFNGAAGVLESTDLESSTGLSRGWNEPTAGFERGQRGFVTPDWNVNDEKLTVLKIDWNEPERRLDVADARTLSWGILHKPSAETCTDRTSYWGQNLNEPMTLYGETVRSGSETLKELTDRRDTVDRAANFVELESVWVEQKSLKDVVWGVTEIQGENSVAYVLDSNRNESDMADLKNLAALKSIWEEEEFCPEASDGLKMIWDSNDTTGADCAVGLASSCDKQTVDLGSCKDLSELKSIWEEKEPPVVCSKGVQQQNWEINQMGADFINLREVQQTWNENQLAVDDLFQNLPNCDQEEASLGLVENLGDLKFIWEDMPQKSKNLKDVMTCCKPESTSLKQSIPSSDKNQLNAGNFLVPDAASVDYRAANLESAKDARFIWEVERRNDGNPNVPATSRWDDQQQELRTDDLVRRDSSPFHAVSDLDNCMLLTSIWERRQSDSGRTSCWDVLESTSEGNAVEATIPTGDTNRRVVAECVESDAGDFQNLAQSLRKAEQQKLGSVMGAVWDTSPSNGGTGAVELTYSSYPQEYHPETFQNVAQLESLWGDETESNSEHVRTWDAKPRETENSVMLAKDKDDSRSPDSFQNLKSIWEENPPDAENVNGLRLEWDTNERAADYLTRLTSSDCDQQEADPGSFQSLMSIWKEKEPDLDSLKGAAQGWDIGRMEPQMTSCHHGQQETDPESFLNLSEVKSIWEGKQSSSESLDKLSSSCWENQTPKLESTAWKTTSQQIPENVNSGIVNCPQEDNDCRNIKSIWEGQQRGSGNSNGPTSCWKQQRVESEMLNAGTSSNWNVTCLDSQSFDDSLFDLNCQKLESENFESVMSSHGDMKQSNSEIFLDRRPPMDPGCSRRPTSDRDLRYQEFGGLATSNVDLWQSDSDELKQMISRWDKQQTESRGRIRGLLSHFGSQQTNLAAEWQLAEAVNQGLRADSDATTTGLWRLAGRNAENVLLPKLVPSENSAFRDEIPRRFVYRYAFFDPRDVRRCDLAAKDARTETIRHIYEPSNSIVRQLEDLFDDGQRLHTDEALANRPNCLFRPIGEQNSGRDSRQSVGALTGLAPDIGDLSVQIKSPSADPSEVVEPDSPYQLYLGVESQAFVPRFRVHKELEKSAQTGEATPPMQNNECVFGMNVILSTIALLE